MKIGIVGRKKDTNNYEQFLHSMKVMYVTSLSLGQLATCDALIFPGGGDINPALFGEKNHGSRHIDTELDLLQLQAFEEAMRNDMPILGICKGMQLINVALGGTILQHLPTASYHTSQNSDLYHPTRTAPGSFLYKLYGENFITNSRHHQSVKSMGTRLLPVQWCSIDNCVEAFIHETLPIFGVQWHPERIASSPLGISGLPLFQYFLAFG